MQRKPSQRLLVHYAIWHFEFPQVTAMAKTLCTHKCLESDQMLSHYTHQHTCH